MKPACEIFLPGAADTEAAGARLARCLEGGMIVTLSGELGAGKTTLTRGCLRALGWQGPVKSPTYGIVEHYLFSSLYFYHIDFYRFTHPDEWETAGVGDCFRPDAVCLVEWPERVGGHLPPADVELRLLYVHDPDIAGRYLAAAAHGARGERCVNALMAAPAPHVVPR
jgi:tRNA threonylcarbamoyladenosine biosynthesis protein TsaE